MLTPNLRRLLVIVAIACFVVGLLMGIDLLDTSHESAWLFGGLAAFAAAHLP